MTRPRRVTQKPSTFTELAKHRAKLSWLMLQVMEVEVAQSGVNCLTIMSTVAKSMFVLRLGIKS